MQQIFELLILQIVKSMYKKSRDKSPAYWKPLLFKGCSYLRSLVEYSVRRLLPIIAKERKKHERRKELLSEISNHFAEGEKLLSKAEEMLGSDDIIVDKLQTAMTVYKHAFDDITNSKVLWLNVLIRCMRSLALRMHYARGYPRTSYPLIQDEISQLFFPAL